MKHIGRKIYHLTGGAALIYLYALLGRRLGLLTLAGVFAVATGADIARLRIPAFNEFMYRRFPKFIRASERNRLTGTPWYVLGVLLSAAFYGLPVALYAVAFLACGDVAATAVGERWGSVKLAGPKSLQGTAAFFIASAVAGAAIDLFLYPVSPSVFLAGAALASVVEVLPTGIDDNLLVPVVSGGLMRLLLAVL